MKRKSLPTGRDFLFVEGYGNENPGAFQSTRPLRGATSDHPWRNLWAWVFQPTRPLRGATRRIDLCFDVIIFQPTRPLRGATDAQAAAGEGQTKFQPTRPLRGATILEEFDLVGTRFQPTRPLRGATNQNQQGTQYTQISTHAPLAGRD